MVGALLLRGMLVGLVAGILSFGFLKIAGEPAVDRSIAFEAAMNTAKAEYAIANGMPAPEADDDIERVSRPTQAGIGLFTGVTVYNTAVGGLFALAFALVYRRMGDFGPRTTAALLAVSGIIAVYLAPSLKYPASPPSVGAAETIGMRTGLYFAMIAISLGAMIAAWALRSRLLARHGAWNASLIAAAFYLIAVVAAGLALPAVNEVPPLFPAAVLWQFRVASLGAQVVMWTTIGLAFGAWTEAAQADQSRRNLGRRRFIDALSGR